MNKLNWPTAFVIVALIFAGAFVYNKPTGAVLGGSAGMISGGHQGQSFFQTIDGKVYAGRTCKAVGQGVLSRLVVFANKLFANIAGKSIQSKTDLVVIDSGMGDVSSFRNSWREGNF